MKSKLVLLLAAAAGAALIFAADAPKKEVTELDKLKAKVTLLEGRISQLEARVLSLSQTPRTTFETPAFQLQPESVVPPNVGSLDVNGLKVYKVPLTQPLK